MEPTRVRPRTRVRATGALGLVFACAVAVLTGCRPAPSGPPPPGPPAPPDAVTTAIFDRTNADRAARGLPPLAWDPRLAGLADEWAHYLADEGLFFHRELGAVLDLPGFEGYAALGENILVSPWAVEGAQMQQAWLNSPRHAANIFGPYDGFGVATARDDRGAVKAVANFARRGP